MKTVEANLTARKEDFSIIKEHIPRANTEKIMLKPGGSVVRFDQCAWIGTQGASGSELQADDNRISTHHQ